MSFHLGLKRSHAEQTRCGNPPQRVLDAVLLLLLLLSGTPAHFTHNFTSRGAQNDTIVYALYSAAQTSAPERGSPSPWGADPSPLHQPGCWFTSLTRLKNRSQSANPPLQTLACCERAWRRGAARRVCSLQVEVHCGSFLCADIKQRGLP